jgi:peptide-methionine (S)-S-oxide reductase
MAAVFYHDDRQRSLAGESRARESRRRGKRIRTEIRPAAPFYPAEDYHQKYMLRRHRSLFDEYLAIYPRIDDLIASTAVARVNGYLGGYGSGGQLASELDRLGLSRAGRRQLVRIHRGLSRE